MPRRTSVSGKDVFLNCPFDETYQPIFHAIVFTLQVCGFTVRSALEVDNAVETRFEKIVRMIRHCPLGIHDISRTELNSQGLPRFNMPLELGLFLGDAKFGPPSSRRKVALILDQAAHRYQQFISDIAGQDIKPHHNDPLEAIRAVRKWLVTVDGGRPLPGGNAIATLYQAFVAHLPQMLTQLQLGPNEVQFADINRIISTWIERTASASRD